MAVYHSPYGNGLVVMQGFACVAGGVKELPVKWLNI